MNGYRLVGDVSHVLAILILLIKLTYTRSAAGVSGKSLILYALTYAFRYTDLFAYWVSTYNTAMKIFFIVSNLFLAYQTFVPLKKTYDKENDSFWTFTLVIPVSILALVLNHELSILEICWTWSIYLEAVAIAPQLYLIWKSGNVDNYVMFYLLALVLYRGMYILNWVYRYYWEEYFDMIAIGGGIVEVSLGILGSFAVVALKIRRMDCFNKGTQSIYSIPGVIDQFEKDTAPILISAKDVQNNELENRIQP